MAEELSEQEAALAFVNHVTAGSQRVWPDMYESLRRVHTFEVCREDVAAYDLALAAIALGLQAVKNLFPDESAERIREWVFKSVDVEHWGAHAADALNEFSSAYDAEFAALKTGGDPLGAVASRLLDRWVAGEIQQLEVEVEGIRVVSPLLMMALNLHLTELATSWSWKTVREKFHVVPITNRLNQFLKGAADKPYRDLIAHHIKHQPAGELEKSLLGERASLPPNFQPHMDNYVTQSWVRLVHDIESVPRFSCRQAFDAIIRLAVDSLPLNGHMGCADDALKPENHDLAFQLFQIATVNLAYMASTQRSLRAAMGIKKGLFG